MISFAGEGCGIPDIDDIEVVTLVGVLPATCLRANLAEVRRRDGLPAGLPMAA